MKRSIQGFQSKQPRRSIGPAEAPRAVMHHVLLLHRLRLEIGCPIRFQHAALQPEPRPQRIRLNDTPGRSRIS